MVKINIPKLDSELFEIVGYYRNKYEWTDKELEEHIAVLDCVMRYLRARDDCGIVLYKLRQEYNTLLGFKIARERSRDDWPENRR